MATYLVTFEIEQLANRTALLEALKGFKIYCPIHKNAWAISSDQKAAEIRDVLRPYIQPTDKLFVIRSGTEAAWLNSYGPKNDEWLKKWL